MVDDPQVGVCVKQHKTILSRCNQQLLSQVTEEGLIKPVCSLTVPVPGLAAQPAPLLTAAGTPHVHAASISLRASRTARAGFGGFLDGAGCLVFPLGTCSSHWVREFLCTILPAFTTVGFFSAFATKHMPAMRTQDVAANVRSLQQEARATCRARAVDAPISLQAFLSGKVFVAVIVSLSHDAKVVLLLDQGIWAASWAWQCVAILAAVHKASLAKLVLAVHLETLQAHHM